MTADAQDRPLRFILTAGQAHDAPQAISLMTDIPAGAVIVDKAYDSDDVRVHIERLEAKAIIPPRSNRTNPPDCDRELYKQRNKIERLINKLKRFRRFATRYDRRPSHFRATIPLAAAVIRHNQLSIPPNSYGRVHRYRERASLRSMSPPGILQAVDGI